MSDDETKQPISAECAQCGKLFELRAGMPVMYCGPCIEKLSKPNVVANAYKKSTADAMKAHKSGLPWGYREKKEPKTEDGLKQTVKSRRQGA